MYYTIYKITNKVNNKIYVGKHQTRNLYDGYMGSGKLVKRAINKYGKENFSKEILFVFNNEEDMNNKEKELVVVSEQTYNLCPGGQGGFGYVNENKLGISENQKKKAREIAIHVMIPILNTEKYKQTRIKRAIKSASTKKKLGYNNPFCGKLHSEETKRKMSIKASERIKTKNSQYGTCWITNGTENKKIKLNSIIPEGFYKGRIKKTFT